MMTVYIHIVVYGVYLSSDLLLIFKNDIDYCSYYVCTYMIDYIVTCHICTVSDKKIEPACNFLISPQL